ncbi:MAG: DUF192 domain-containing protein [Nanoarchaeota archaeon]|nr:DUF192 domain-containing protein [Nanoarchaeota archaeon]
MISKKNLIFIIIFFIILVFLFSYLINSNKNRVCFNKNCFKVEIASTPEELSKGLMFRESLDKNSGMLFIFPENGIYSFWMKNTLIPLDIIWINSDKEIVFIKENVQPCLENDCESFSPNETAKYVLELNSGTTENIGLSVGDNLKIKIKKN